MPEALPNLHYCVTHSDLIRGRIVGECCSFDKCGHVPRCDVRRLLLDDPPASNDDRTSGLPLVPPICPTCKVACLHEMSTPEVGSGVVSERHYCPMCGWNPEVDSG